MSLKGGTNEEKIWNFLRSSGLNDFGVAGLMGNLKAESNLSSINLQNTYEKKLGLTDAEYTKKVDNGSYTNFVKDSAGYGLAQWTYWSRKQNLLNYAKQMKTSIGDLEMQLNFLVKELKGYSAVLSILKTAKSVQEASDIVLTQFERPANQGASVKKTRASYGQTYYNKYVAVQDKEVKPMSTVIKTGAELAKAAINVAKNFKTLYVMGCFGAPMNASNKTRYCNNHSYNKQSSRTAMIKAATDDTFGFDCVCLIKGLLWGWSGDKSKTYGGAGYAINGVPDIGADTMITKCSGISTDFSNIEIGEVVWMTGHIGIYVGDGLAVECTPKWSNKVQITACNCSKSGYNRRDWTKHGKLPYISYTGSSEKIQTPASEKKTVQQLAQEVLNGVWGNGDARKKALTAAGYNYSEVQSAVNALCSKPSQTSWTPKVGDIVNYTGKVHYANANASSGPACKGGKAKITAIYQLGKSKHPYHLVRVSGSGATVYGWVDAGTFTKA